MNEHLEQHENATGPPDMGRWSGVIDAEDHPCEAGIAHHCGWRQPGRGQPCAEPISAGDQAIPVA